MPTWPTYRNVMEVWESHLKLWLAAYLDQGVKTTDSPTFAGLTLTAMSGVVKATAGVLSGGAEHSDLAGITANQHHDTMTVVDSDSIHLALSGQQITAILFDGVTIDCGTSNVALDTDFSFDGGYSL